MVGAEGGKANEMHGSVHRDKLVDDRLRIEAVGGDTEEAQVGSRQEQSGRWTDDVKVRLVLRTISIAWLLALGEPIRDLFREHSSLLPLVVSLLGVAVFVVVYVWAVIRSEPYVPVSRPTASKELALPKRPFGGERLRRWLPLAVLTVLGVVYTLRYGNPWLDLLVFAGVAAGYRLRIGQAAWVVPGIAMLPAILGIAMNGSPASAGPAFLLILSVGIGIATGIYALATVRELRAARGELARLAVAEERLRFARDLHDLLGHSLSLIALKSDLAGQLALQAPERAANEMRDVEGVARTALREVREAVAGYRQPTLASELAAAAEILAAAGIELQSQGRLDELPAQAEAALAWTVREGVTNVIRHSRASGCTIRLLRNGNVAAAEVTDNGKSAQVELAEFAHRAGHSGLAGLAERITAVGGRIEAGPADDGFRLLVVVPVEHGHSEASERQLAPDFKVPSQYVTDNSAGELG